MVTIKSKKEIELMKDVCKIVAEFYEQLEKKVDKHNNFASRMPVIEEQIKVINHRIDDLEREAKNYENH